VSKRAHAKTLKRKDHNGRRKCKGQKKGGQLQSSPELSESLKPYVASARKRRKRKKSKSLYGKKFATRTSREGRSTESASMSPENAVRHENDNKKKNSAKKSF